MCALYALFPCRAEDQLAEGQNLLTLKTWINLTSVTVRRHKACVLSLSFALSRCCYYPALPPEVPMKKTKELNCSVC